MSDWRRLGEQEWRGALARHGVGGRLAGDLAAYLVALARWEGAVDLVGRVDEERLLRDHVLESLAGLPHLPAEGTLLDVGSGNGFPAIPLLLACRSLRGVLLEPRERRWAFLREVCRELGLAAEVRREPLEEHRGVGYDALTVRAVAPRAWSHRAAVAVRPGGVLLWWATAADASRALPGWEPVLTSPLPTPERGAIAVWRRCST